MTSAIATDPAPRSVWARIGCVALNVFYPGLGCIRIGAWRVGGALLLAPVVWMAASAIVFAAVATPSFRLFVGYAAAAIILFVAIYLVAFVLTWRWSAVKVVPKPWWARWYGIALIVIANIAALNLAMNALWKIYKPFYLPTESMAPTLNRFDKLIADMRFDGRPKPGDLVLVRSRRAIFVKRVAALPGSRIAMHGDVPVIDGKAAEIQPAGSARFQSGRGWETGRLLQERLPGERAPHSILITHATPYGEMGEAVVPPGHVFLLGDNREQSADSRLPAAQMGLGMVPISDIVGRPLYITWSQDHGRIGRSLRP